MFYISITSFNEALLFNATENPSSVKHKCLVYTKKKAAVNTCIVTQGINQLLLMSKEKFAHF